MKTENSVSCMHTRPGHRSHRDRRSRAHSTSVTGACRQDHVHERVLYACSQCRPKLLRLHTHHAVMQCASDIAAKFALAPRAGTGMQMSASCCLQKVDIVTYLTLRTIAVDASSCWRRTIALSHCLLHPASLPAPPKLKSLNVLSLGGPLVQSVLEVYSPSLCCVVSDLSSFV